MKLTEANLKVFKKSEDEFALKVMMPDGSDNYLHGGGVLEVNELLETRDSLLGQEILKKQIEISPKEKYFRIILRITDTRNITHYFHSRKLNLNDAVFERMQLIISDD